MKVRVRRYARGLIGEVIEEDGKESDIPELQTHDSFDSDQIVEQVLSQLAYRECISVNEAKKLYTVEVVPWEGESLDMWMVIKETLNVLAGVDMVDNEVVERLVSFYRHNFYSTNYVAAVPHEVVNMYKYALAYA